MYYNASFYIKNKSFSEDTEVQLGKYIYKINKKGKLCKEESTKHKAIKVFERGEEMRVDYDSKNFVKALMSRNITFKLKEQIDKKSKYCWEFAKVRIIFLTLI